MRAARYGEPPGNRGAASSGQQVIMGIRLRSTSRQRRFFVGRVHHAVALSACSYLLKLRQFIKQVAETFWRLRSFRNANNLPTSRSAETSSCPCPSPRALAYRTGCTAPALRAFRVFEQQRRPTGTQSAVSISVISRCGSTGSVIRFSSPCVQAASRSRVNRYISWRPL